MRKQVILTLIEGSLELGFLVILRIREGNNFHETETQGRLPPALNILQVFNNWQLAYSQWQSTYRIKANPGQVTNFSSREIASLGSQLVKYLNEWLNSDFEDWKRIREQLLFNLSKTDEIQFIIQTENVLIRQLPWHSWHLFSEYYTKAEFALSAPQHRPSPPPNPTNGVKILAILGDTTGIDIEQDKTIVQKQLPDAEIEFLTQPQLQLLSERLWDQQWDILFFAGHSSSQADGSTCRISINQDDSISLRDLKNALRKAISKGLQLAIFNSCDGLGLVQELANLNIPQIIVMRKPVPDFVAQEFLRHFLRVFASGTSLYLAVREARERLQSLENQFPCASWLPVICQNPTREPLTWQEMKNFPKKVLPTRRWQRLLKITAVAAAVVGVGYCYSYAQQQMQKSEKAALEVIQLLKAGKNYQACVHKAEVVLLTSPFSTPAQNLLNECRQLAQDQQWLTQAQEQAQQKNWQQAIAQASQIQPGSSWHTKAQQLINHSSLELVKQAKQRYQQSYNSKELANVMALTQAIPQTSPVAKSAKTMSQQWSREWHHNQDDLQAAHNALQQGKWQEAIEETHKVRLLGQEVKPNTPYWQHQVQPIVTTAQQRIAAGAIWGSSTNQTVQPELPSPQFVPSPVPYLPRQSVPTPRQSVPTPRQPVPTPRQPVHTPAKPKPVPSPVRHLSKQPVSAPAKPQPSNIQPPPFQLSPKGQQILCEQFPLNSRCGSKH